MITLRKLESLPRKTRLRKTVQLLEAFERDCRAGREIDLRYLAGMAGFLRDDERIGVRVRDAADRLTARPEPSLARICRNIDALRNALLRELGREPAEWDLMLPEGAGLDRSARRLRDFYVYLEDLRSPYNVGAVFRSAESFGVREVFLSADTPPPDHPRARRSSMGATEAVPWQVCSLAEAVERAGAAGARGAPAVFALETGGRPLHETPLPEPGLVVLGSEELGVSPEGLALAESSSGRVSIDMAGAKASLNVAVAFGILAHTWWHSPQAEL